MFQCGSCDSHAGEVGGGEEEGHTAGGSGDKEASDVFAHMGRACMSESMSFQHVCAGGSAICM